VSMTKDLNINRPFGRGYYHSTRVFVSNYRYSCLSCGVQWLRDTGRCPRTGDHQTRQVDQAMTDPRRASGQQHAVRTASVTHGLYCHAGGPGRRAVSSAPCCSCAIGSRPSRRSNWRPAGTVQRRRRRGDAWRKRRTDTSHHLCRVLSTLRLSNSVPGVGRDFVAEPDGSPSDIAHEQLLESARTRPPDVLPPPSNAFGPLPRIRP
jgi:hypothetical protein